MTAATLRAYYKCGCNSCIHCYLRELEEDRMVEELRKEMDDRDLMVGPMVTKINEYSIRA